MVNIIPGAPKFAEGDQVVLFLKVDGPSIPIVTGTTQGVYRVTTDPRERRPGGRAASRGRRRSRAHRAGRSQPASAGDGRVQRGGEERTGGPMTAWPDVAPRRWRWRWRSRRPPPRT